MDQAAFANQLLRKLDERRQNLGLDRGVRLCAGGDLEEGAAATASSHSILQILIVSTFEKVPHQVDQARCRNPWYSGDFKYSTL